MKTAIIKGAKIGARTGFLSALGYAVIALIIIEMFLPIPDPSAIVIFDDGLGYILSSLIIPTSPFWLLGSIAIGVITAICFVIYLTKANPNRKKFVTVCTFACLLITSPLLILSTARAIYAFYFNGVFHPFINPFIDNLLEVIFPCMIYILAGLYSSNYLYKNVSTKNSTSITS